jgi:sugar (pentulose or hexulose) kinase
VDGGMWLGFDVGTQSIRAMAVSETGHVLGQSSQPLTSRRDGPKHEQDPEHWWRATVAACRSLVADLPAHLIRALAVDGTSGTIVLIDRSGNPLTPGIMYDDARATGEAQHADEAGAPLWAALGYRMQPTWALPKLLWLRREYQNVISHARLAHQADFINRRLAGCEVASDTSNALKTGYDVIRERWPLDVLEALDVPEYLLPQVVRPGTIIGAVCAEAAVQTGIPAGTPIVVGMTDGCAAQISAGALQVGSWNSVLGTTLVLKGVSDSLIRDTAGVVYSHRLPEGKWLPGGASNTGAAVLAQRFPGKDLDALSALAAQREPVTIIAYPLVSRGERFPFVAPDAEGFVLGDIANDIDLFAALLQGVSFIERLCFEYLELLGAPVGGDVSLTGGGARNRHWRQLRADVLGRSVRLPENTEPAFGMAVLAASAGRKISDAAQNMVRIREIIDPRRDRSARLHELYLQLVDELVRRGWLETRVAEHARRRVG